MAKKDPFKYPHASYVSQSELDAEAMNEMFIEPRWGPPREGEEDLNYNTTLKGADINPMDVEHQRPKRK